MPIPSRARNRNSNPKLGARPASRLHTENHAIEIISGFFRPMRSASQPDAVAPTSRSQSVMVNTAVTAVSGTLNDWAMGNMSSRKIVKSNESSVHPNHAAIQACHWSLVGSLHQGIVPTDVDMVGYLP